MRARSPGTEQQLRELAQDIETKLQQIRRILRKQLEQEYAKGNLTIPQRMVMEVIVRNQGVSVKELSQRVSLTHSTVSGIVDRLQKKGLIERLPSQADRRITILVASKAVHAFLKEQGPDLTRAPLMAALKKATRPERAIIRHGLETLARLLAGQ